MTLPKRELVRNMILNSMISVVGEDNADTDQDDEFHIGVSFPSGEFITIQVGDHVS